MNAGRMRYAVVGCHNCSRLWILDEHQRQKTSTCPSCGTTHDARKLRRLKQHEDHAAACELRTRLLAERTGEAEAYAQEDDYATLADRADEYLEAAADRFGEFVDVSTPGADYLEAEAEAYLDRLSDRFSECIDFSRERVLEAEADAVAGTVVEKPDCPPKSTPGTVTLSRQATFDGLSVTVDEETTPGEIWKTIAASPAFEAALSHAVETLVQDVPTRRWGAALYAQGVTALDGAYARIVANLARDDPEHEGIKVATNLTASLGQRGRSPGGFQNPPLESVREGPVAVVEAAETTPTITVVLDDSFRERPATDRQRTCELIAWLARAFDVRLAAGPITLRWLAQTHASDLPGSVREQLRSNRPAGKPVEETVRAAREALDYDGSAVAVLRVLADADSETRTYSALTSALPVTRSTIRNHLSTLRDLGLISESFSIGGETAVELRQAGREYLSTLDAEIGQQKTIGESVRGTGNPSGHPCNHAGKHGETPPPEAAAAAVEDDLGRRTFHQIEYLSRREHAAATATAPSGGVAVTSYPVERRQGRLNGGWSYDSVRDELVVSAEFVNVLPWRVTLARLLTDWRVWEHVLDEDRLEDAVGDLVQEHKDVLRAMRCLGYLPDSIESAEGYRDALQDARERLLELTQDLHHEEYDLPEEEFRGVICREALGLAGTAMHLLDLAGVDVVIEVRLPTYTRDFDTDRRETLLETLTTEATVFSKYGHHVARRHLYEHREAKREQVFNPTVDAENPFGDLIPSYSIVGVFGSKQEPFAAALEDALAAPGDLHDDAPEFAVPVTVTTDTEHNREQTAGAARRVLEAKHLELARETLSVLTAFATTPYDVADALSELSAEEAERDLRVDEVRFALAHLDTGRLLPDAPPTVQAVLSALFGADAPLSRKELADRAGVTTRSVRSHLDVLFGMGIIEEIPEGIRLTLSFHTDEECYVDALPTLVTDDLRFARDAVYETLEQLGVDDPAVWDVWIVESSEVPDVDRLVEQFDWVGWSLPFLRALADQPKRSEEHTRRPTFGANIEQASLQSAVDEASEVNGRAAV